MHAVIIRIGGYYYIVVAQIVNVVFHSERTDQQIEFFVFDHPPAAFLVRIDGLSAKAEHCLVIGIAGFCDGSACRVALSNEYAAVFDIVFCIITCLVAIMIAAVAEFAVVDRRLAIALARLLLYAGNLLPLLLRSLYLFFYYRHNILMNVQIIVEILGYEVVYITSDGGSYIKFRQALFVVSLLFPHIIAPELGFGLAFEVRFLNQDADGSNHALPAVGRFVVFLEEVFEGFGDSFAVSGEMGTAVTGVLAVHERRYVLAVFVIVCKHHLYVFACQMDRGVERFVAKEIFVHQV